MHQFFSGPFFNFEVIRILGTAPYGGADVAECLEAIGKIRQNDPISWERAWSEQAEKAEKVAQDAQRSGHRLAARQALLRASNYTRASAYMITGSKIGHGSPRVVPILQKAVDLFQAALPLFDGPVRKLWIPYEIATDSKDQEGNIVLLPAYLYLPPPNCRLPPQGKTPLLVNFIGADSMQEEIYYMFPAAGPALGYAVLTVEGPGQGLTLHEHGVPMRPDWETVSRVVLDFISEYAEERADDLELDLDLDRVAVAGASLGGYFALRSAVDERYKACVAIDPVYDLWEFAAQHSGPVFFGLWKQGWIPDGFMDAMVLLGTKVSFQMQFEIFTSAYFLGVRSPADILRAMQKYTFRREGGGQTDEEQTTDGGMNAKDGGAGSTDANSGPSSGSGGSGSGSGSGSYLRGIRCPVLLTGGADALYFDTDKHTTRISRELTPTADTVEVWVGSSPGEGSLQAKMGALPLCNQRAFDFLDRHLKILRTKPT